MARFVELEQESGETVWVNPEHIVAVTPGREEGCWLLTEMGQRIKVVWKAEAVVGYLECEDDIAPIDLTDAGRALVRENLNRGACTGDPCICTNGIGCVTVPLDRW